jgi:anti-sigma regulatory factor (Ser/Thr protein kinase)
MERSFPRDFASLDRIVGFVREFVSAERLEETLAFDMDLVLEELFTNQVKYGGRSSHDIDIRLERGERGVIMTMRDFDSQPFDPTLAPKVNVDRTPDEYRPGGLGIHLVRQLTERFEFEYLDRVCTITVALREPH